MTTVLFSDYKSVVALLILALLFVIANFIVTLMNTKKMAKKLWADEGDRVCFEVNGEKKWGVIIECEGADKVIVYSEGKEYELNRSQIQ